MRKKPWLIQLLPGLLAGCVTGLFGAGGGMILIPLLTLLLEIPEETLFPTSLCIMLPIALVSLIFGTRMSALPWPDAWPYLAGGTAGGLISGILGKRIPVSWLHRGLGILILWGGMRYLC